MADNRMNFAKDISYMLRNNYGDKLRVFKTEIPLAIKAAETSAEGKSIYTHDSHGKAAAAYAMLRSSAPNSTFLREVDGSDKRYSFSLPPQPFSSTLYLFESAIDCLSFVELQRMETENWRPGNYLSLSGVYQPKKELSETPLPIALMQFLRDNPHVIHVALCLDNDDAGRTAAMAISALLPERYTTELLPPAEGKDYNEQLMRRKGLPMAVKTREARYMAERGDGR